MHFIHLTVFNQYSRTNTPAVVNVALVTQMQPIELKLVAKTTPAMNDEGTKFDYSKPAVETHPAMTFTGTLISFCVGMGEEVDAIYVAESLEDIMEMI